MSYPLSISKYYKILYVSGSKIIASKGYRLYISNDSGASWQYWSEIEWNIYSLFSNIRFLARLTRSEISAMYCLSNGDYICIAKKGIYKFDPASSLFIRIKEITRGSRPLHIAEDKEGCLYYGDYFSNMEREPANIYCSEDYGNTWRVIYTFPGNTINHIHGVFYDKFDRKLWVATGDKDDECLIGYSDNKFRTFKVLFKGGENYRAVKLLFYKDYILYGTDSPAMKNKIYKIYRGTNKHEFIFDVQGSVINATQINNYAIFSTAVEPSKINNDLHSYLWRYDGNEWECIASFKKDFLHMLLFQFGTVQFPEYGAPGQVLYFSGHALKGIDGHSLALNM